MWQEGMRGNPRICLTEGAVAQLEAELELERQASANVAAEKIALREHLSSIVSHLRPTLAAMDPSDLSRDPPQVPLHEIKEAEDIIEATSDYGGSRKVSAEFSRSDFGGSRKASAEFSSSVSFDAWGSSRAVSHAHSEEAAKASMTHSSIPKEAPDASSSLRQGASKGTSKTQQPPQGVKLLESSVSPIVPDTPAKLEGPPQLQAASSSAAAQKPSGG